MTVAYVVREISSGALSAVYVVTIELRTADTVGNDRTTRHTAGLIGSEESRLTGQTNGVSYASLVAIITVWNSRAAQRTCVIVAGEIAGCTVEASSSSKTILCTVSTISNSTTADATNSVGGQVMGNVTHGANRD